MTTKELLEKAKAVGGWHVTAAGRIRTVNRHDAYGDCCCPVAAVLECDNSVAADTLDAIGFDRDIRRKIIRAADNKRDVPRLWDDDIRKEMESWCS